MSNQQDFNWIFDRDYCGRILQGEFSNELKKRVAESILLFRNFNVNVNPSMPYISAWREDADKAIWYEFAGNRLLYLLGCQSCEVAEIFRDSVLQRCSYQYGSAGGKIKKRILEHKDLSCIQDELRNEGKTKGTVEAVYKISLPNRPAIWLKDQASVESFPVDHICLSFGSLTDVTMEMQAEEQHQLEEQALRSLHAELELKIEKQNKELWKMQLEMIYRLAQAAQLRDKCTGMHITKMSHYCDILSEAAGLSDEERLLLFHATSMHDVGKLGIAEAILQKPGKLSGQEFEIMKTHSIIGAKLLSGNDSPLLKMAKAIALTHHESWDGTGYPHGLEHEEIPISGRIAAICDVFDALTSARPYKKAWQPEEAFAEVERSMGTKFDPELAALFLEKKSNIEEIQQRFATEVVSGHA
ncbi:MAG: HD domain-containing protein [Deltaproteobacteria bacterium]|nr:HD domain-containing protein [Deltaproteobacteria bacterium]